MTNNNLSKKRVVALLMIMVLVMSVFFACSPSDKNDKPQDQTAVNKENDDVTDYSNSKNWASAPKEVEHDIDVFYVYPTVWAKNEGEKEYICQEDDPRIIEGVSRVSAMQASVFEGFTNLFLPYYRQVDAVLALSLEESENEKLMTEAPYPDCLAAFDYYIKNLNNGRPFILAGHSQGSTVLKKILSTYMKENPEVYERMIAAYVIGVSITDSYLKENPHLKFAQGSDDTGVIISYNTEMPDFTGNNALILPDANVINPINWKRDDSLATVEENLGSLVAIDGVQTLTDGVADAKINLKRGVIECSSVNPDEYFVDGKGFEKGVYHIFDYNFYYNNLKENAQNRIVAFNLAN